MSRCIRVHALAVVLLLCTIQVSAQSQASTGVIEGVVTDESGGVLPGATVAVKNTATNYEAIAVADRTGRFRAGLLPLGPYRLTVTLSGFGTLVREGISLGMGQSPNLTLGLKSSYSEETIVTADVPTVETTRTAGSTRIDNDSIEGLPNNGRNFLDYMNLTPGVSIVQGPDGEELSVNGQKGIHNNVMVDGADFNNPFFGEQRGGQRPAFTFNLDAIQEMAVIGDGANAEFGRSSGGFVNVVTKSGTNEPGGTVHAFFRGTGISSNPQNPDGSEAPKGDGSQEQVGFTLGGPIERDRLFYFIALDVQNGSLEKQTDPSRIEPRVVDAFASLGSPDENGSITRSDDARVFLAKADWMPGTKNLYTLRYNYTWSEQENGTFDVDSWGRSANAIERGYSNAITGSVLTQLRSKTSEFRFQYAREDRPRPYNGPNITGQDRPLPDTAFDFGASYRFGEPFFIPVKYDDERLQLNENMTFLRGAHAIKAGVEYNQVSANQTFVGFGNGRYIFSSTDGFLNYLHNPSYVECSDGSSSNDGICPSGTSVTGPVLLYLQQAGVGGISVEEAGTQTITQKEPAVFIQDNWQASPRLNIQYGLRWEAQIQPDPITAPKDVFFADFIGTTSNGQEFPSDGTIPSDKNMWQPRLGVAWQTHEDGSGVIRATAGIYYARVPGLVLASTRSTNGSRGQTLFRSSALSSILGPVPAYPNLIPANEIGDPFLPDVFVFDKNFQNPRTTAFSLSWEEELIKNYSFLVKYNYARGDHMTRFVNRNDPLLGSPWSTGLGADGTNGINTLTVVESSAKSRYEGLTLGVTKHWANDRFQFQAYYTYSKDKSDDDNERDPFSFRYAKVTDLDAEWGYSDRDQRHRFNGWFLWQAPWDLDVNLRYAYRSAQPKSIKADGTDAQTPQDRINPDGSVTQRNLGRKDNEYSSFDVRFSKSFPAGRMNITPIIDVFNLFNSKNLQRPEVTNLIFNFDGTVQSGAGEPRQIQAGLKFDW